MAYSQVVPKENPARNNKHQKLIFERRDGSLIGPDLPKIHAWHDEAKVWYDQWRKSPIAPHLEESDWLVLRRTASLVNDFWFGVLPPTQKVSYAAEIRRVESAYGGTVEDRLKLRMQFVDPEKNSSNSVNVKPGTVYREMFEESG